MPASVTTLVLLTYCASIVRRRSRRRLHVHHLCVLAPAKVHRPRARPTPALPATHIHGESHASHGLAPVSPRDPAVLIPATIPTAILAAASLTCIDLCVAPQVHAMEGQPSQSPGRWRARDRAPSLRRLVAVWEAPARACREVGLVEDGEESALVVQRLEPPR